jgi:hypothetical protein
MYNSSLTRVAKRLTTLVCVPLLLLSFALLFPAALPVWLITGMELDDQMEWLEDKSATYWDWARGV